MGNSMDLSTGPEVPASGTGPSHARYIAGRTHGSSLNASKEVSDIQSSDTVQQLASTETSKMEVPAPHVGRLSKPSIADSTTVSAKTSVTEDCDRTQAVRLTTVGMVRRCGPGSWVPRTGPGR